MCVSNCAGSATARLAGYVEEMAIIGGVTKFIE
jgi:hypothetical protein